MPAQCGPLGDEGYFWNCESCGRLKSSRTGGIFCPRCRGSFCEKCFQEHHCPQEAARTGIVASPRNGCGDCDKSGLFDKAALFPTKHVVAASTTLMMISLVLTYQWPRQKTPAAVDILFATNPNQQVSVRA